MNNVEKLTVAGLLHDIGKVVRRGDSLKGDHTKRGIEFLRDDAIQMDDKDEILQMIQNHHHSYLSNANLPNDNLSYILYEADNISAGFDRRKYDDNAKGDEMMALKSVYSAIHYNSKHDNYYISPDPTKEEEILLPQVSDKPLFTSTAEYYQLKDRDLRANIKAFKISSETINSLLGLLEATMSNIPSSSYADRPDIALYDHSKLTGAIASSMYLYLEEKEINDYKSQLFKDKNAINNFRDENTFIFVSAEISGVQSFIYSIANYKAMKSLRGRSLYLELLSEHIIDEILDEMNLSRCNLVYSGASSFYLLLPNTAKAKETLDSIKKRVNDFLLERYSVELYFEISHVECSVNDLSNNFGADKKTENLLGDLFRENSRKTGVSKRNRYSETQLRSLFNHNSALNTLDDLDRECSICKSSNRLKADSTQDGEKYICCDCDSFIKLGAEIAKASNKKQDFYFVCSDNISNKSEVSLEMPSIKDAKNRDNFKKFKLLSDKEVFKYLENIDDGEKARIYSINKKTIGQFVTANLWVGDYNIPSADGGGLIEFDELANLSTGIKRLAVMRADIDNLGALFANGFEDKASVDNKYRFASISRIATLSRSLSEFFKKNINQIATRSYNSDEFEYFNLITDSFENPRNLVIVYAGGDDVFVIGTWGDVIEFAIDLREIFSLYSVYKLTFSAGIGFFKNGYPISQMAINAEKLEKMAKDNDGKDSVALFGIDAHESERHVYKWNDFIDDVLDDKFKSLKRWFYFEEDSKENGKLFAGKSFLYKLLNLARINLQADKKSIDLARLVYTLSRLSYNDEQEDTFMEMRSQIIKWFMNEKDLKMLLTALNLIIYEIRE